MTFNNDGSVRKYPDGIPISIGIDFNVDAIVGIHKVGLGGTTYLAGCLLQGFHGGDHDVDDICRIGNDIFLEHDLTFDF